MRCRLAAAVFCVALLAGPLPAAVGSASRSWAHPEIELVTSKGLFSGEPATFRPSDPLTADVLAQAVAGLTGRPLAVPADPAAHISISQLDSVLVHVLGLANAAHQFTAEALAAGLRPPGRFGTEVVARLIGLRYDHPPSQDDLELQPQQTATRAEAAFSVARTFALLDPPARRARFFGADPNGAIALVQSWASTFALPQYDRWQKRILQTAVSLIGYPYVWGGDDETTQRGFDCSGLVWRVYKLAGYPGGGGLGDTIRGRTAAQMAAEVPRGERITFANLQPGDVVFFGDGPKPKAAAIGHTAIYLGNGWLIQSSGQGVALAPLSDYHRSSFAWARRPLAEAGLDISTTAAPG